MQNVCLQRFCRRYFLLLHYKVCHLISYPKTLRTFSDLGSMEYSHIPAINSFELFQMSQEGSRESQPM